jgi:hypothetical protein
MHVDSSLFLSGTTMDDAGSLLPPHQQPSIVTQSVNQKAKIKKQEDPWSSKAI